MFFCVDFSAYSIKANYMKWPKMYLGNNVFSLWTSMFCQDMGHTFWIKLNKSEDLAPVWVRGQGEVRRIMDWFNLERYRFIFSTILHCACWKVWCKIIFIYHKIFFMDNIQNINRCMFIQFRAIYCISYFFCFVFSISNVCFSFPCWF